MSESVQEIDNLKVKAKERDLKVQAQKEQLETINKLVENNAKLTHVSILNAVMSKISLMELSINSIWTFCLLPKPATPSKQMIYLF